MVETYGLCSSGKTTVALHTVTKAPAAGGIVAFIDAEHALDPEYAKSIGVDTGALLACQPDSWLRRAAIEGEVGDSHRDPEARLVRPGCGG